MCIVILLITFFIVELTAHQERVGQHNKGVTNVIQEQRAIVKELSDTLAEQVHILVHIY